MEVRAVCYTRHENPNVLTAITSIEKEMLTPPLDGLILPGITRDSIIRLCREWGEFTIKEQKFTMPWIRQLAKKGRVSFF